MGFCSKRRNFHSTRIEVGCERFHGKSFSRLLSIISSDGNIVLVGGAYDNSNIGAAWVWARTGTSWSQQGSKLVGSGYSSAPQQGYSIALNALGNTAAIAGFLTILGTGQLGFG